MKAKIALLLFWIVLQLPSCTSEQNRSSNLTQKSAEQAILDSLANARQDSIKKAEAELKEIANRPWKAGYFTNEYGEQTKEKFIMTSVIGEFSNSATSNEFLLAEVLVKKTAAGIFLHEYNAQNPPQKFVGTARIKLKNSDGKELEIFSSSPWNQGGGILISNFTLVEGAESYDFSGFRNFIKKSEGEIKVVIYDEYSSSYRFSIKSKGFVEEFELL